MREHEGSKVKLVMMILQLTSVEHVISTGGRDGAICVLSSSEVRKLTKLLNFLHRSLEVEDRK